MSLKREQIDSHSPVPSGGRRYLKKQLARKRRRQAKRSPEDAVKKRAWYDGYY